MTEINAERKGRRDPEGDRHRGRETEGQRDRDSDIEIERERKKEREICVLCPHIAFRFTSFYGNIILSIHM